jgi:hypothetical protein
MEETSEQDINPWHLPINKWDGRECLNFAEWVGEYLTDNRGVTMEEAITSYRAVRDIEASVEEKVLKGNERYAYAWTDPKGFFGSLK